MNLTRALATGLAALGAGAMALAASGEQAGGEDNPSSNPNPSPWMLTPLLSSNPKLGTSAGAMGAYVRQLHPAAPPSTFGAMAQYSTTESYNVGAFARAYLGADEHRVVVFAGGGEANNDYQDFLGSGDELESTDDVRVFYGSYLNRIAGDWFVGAHAVVNHYAILGANEYSSMVLDELNLQGFDSNGLGLKAQYDTRDNTQSPTSGTFAGVNQIAYRESLGGEASFDIYSGNWRHYFSHGNFGNGSFSNDKRSVFATRVTGRFTHNAPPSGYSTLRMRGYVPGEFRALHVMTMEGEERYYLGERWRLAVFAGLGCLLEHLDDCGDSGNLYASAGLGIHYVLRPKEKMIVRLDFARGEGGSQGLYMNFGQAF